MNLHPTQCCALSQLSAGNDTTLDELSTTLVYLKAQAFKESYHPGKPGGQRAVFCITTPTEHGLVANLKTLGFIQVNQFNRRNGYPAGLLTMWMLNW